MTNSSFQSHSAPIFSQLKLLTITDIYKLNLAILFHNIQNNKFTGSNNLITIKQIHNYNTRLSSNRNYFQYYNKSNLGIRTFSTAGLKSWRNIPIALKSENLFTFKNKLKKYLIDNYN